MHPTSSTKNFPSPNTFFKPLTNSSSSQVTSGAFSKYQGSSSLNSDPKNTNAHSSKESLSTQSSPFLISIPPPRGTSMNTNPISSLSSLTNSENSSPEVKSTNEPQPPYFEEKKHTLSTLAKTHSIYFSQEKGSK